MSNSDGNSRNIIDPNAPSTPAELSLVRQVEDLLGRKFLPDDYPLPPGPLADCDENGPESEWDPSSEVLTIPRGEFIGPIPDAPQIMARLTGFIRRFLVCSDDQLTVLALWVLHTYCYRTFSVTPCLNIYSAGKSTGKTVCLQLLNVLCPNTWYAVAPAPVAVIQKNLRKPAIILLDDRHLTFSPSGRQQVVNFLACGLANQKLYFAHDHGTVSGYTVFSPRALAGRGPLPSALADRSIPICLRPAKRSGLQRVVHAELEEDYELLIDLITCWAAQNASQIFFSEPDSPVEELAQLNMHQQDYAEPLLLLADLIGGDWPEQARVALRRVFFEARNDKTSHSVALLHDIRDAFNRCGDPERLSTSYLVEHLSQLQNRPWAEWNEGKPINGRSLALLLEGFDIVPDKQRTGSSGSSVRGYNRDNFLPLWQQIP